MKKVAWMLLDAGYWMLDTGRVMRKVFIALVVLSSVSVLPAMAQSRSEQALYEMLTTNESHSVSLAAVGKVVTNSDGLSAAILYTAAGVAFREKRLEDAGFLFYAAQLRARFDRALFLPIGTGGDNPMLALGALQQQLGQVINPAVMRQPKAYASIVERLRSWKPKATRDYEPGWEYAKRRTEKEAEQDVAGDRQKFVGHMVGLSALLLDTNYFKAFQTVQAYNLSSSRSNNRPSKDAYESAVLTIKRVEKDKGIEAVGAVLK
ncbi:MAG: hypothetical protein C5B50_29675 [Verrucomicrobia bacterium]|nr:MAG: hypothetical protein C5B50_29675 [Verrucomicrobiota bacterium]